MIICIVRLPFPPGSIAPRNAAQRPDSFSIRLLENAVCDAISDTMIAPAGLTFAYHSADQMEVQFLPPEFLLDLALVRVPPPMPRSTTEMS